MLPVARFPSVVPPAPFRLPPGFDRRRPVASVKIGGVKIAGSLRLPGVQPIQRQVECELEFAAPTGRHGLGSACIPRRLQRKRVLLQSMRSER
jgi:hypothetical protein